MHIGKKISRVVILNLCRFFLIEVVFFSVNSVRIYLSQFFLSYRNVAFLSFLELKNDSKTTLLTPKTKFCRQETTL